MLNDSELNTPEKFRGKRVKYLGCDGDLRHWAGCDDPIEKLKVDNIYTIQFIEVHNWHTKVKLSGIEGLFNSVCFEEVKSPEDEDDLISVLNQNEIEQQERYAKPARMLRMEDM